MVLGSNPIPISEEMLNNPKVKKIGFTGSTEVGKLLMATQIYDMHRLAHDVSGGLIVALPGPDDDHNPETKGDLMNMLTTRPDIPYQHRMDVARFMEDLTASNAAGWMSVISLHGGGSPEAMRREIYRYYPLQERRELVERLLDRGVLNVDDETSRNRQPGRCCPVGCQVPETPVLAGADPARLTTTSSDDDLAVAAE